MRGQPLAIYGKGKRGLKLALTLRTWSKDLIICTDGPSRLTQEDQNKLKLYKIKVYQEKILKLQGSGGRLESILFASGQVVQRCAIFFNIGSFQRSLLSTKLGCVFNARRDIVANRYEATTVPDLYASRKYFARCAASHSWLLLRELKRLLELIQVCKRKSK